AQDAVAAAKAAASQSTTARAMPVDIGPKARQLAANLHIKEQGERLRTQIHQGTALVDKRPGRLQALKTSGAAGLLLNDEMREVFGPALLDEAVDPANSDAIMTARLFDDDAMFNHSRLVADRLMNPGANGCILRAEDVFDDALLGLTAKIK